MGLLAVPALVVYVLWTDWRVLTRPPVLVGIVIAALVGISLNYLYLPIRAGQYPAINEGEPRRASFSQALSDVLNRVQYGKPPLTERQASFVGQLANFWQYFSWQFARDWGRFAGVATAIFTALGLSGLWALWKSDRRAGVAGLALLGTLSLGLVFYMNFKYGFSQYPDQPSLAREVRERDYFFIGSFAVFGAFIAVGLGALMQSIVDALARPGKRRGAMGRRQPGARARLHSAGGEPSSPPAARTKRWHATSPGTFSSRSSPTASSSPPATTTPSRSGTHRRSKASAAT